MYFLFELKISISFQPKSYYQIKPPIGASSGASFQHSFYPKIFFSVCENVKNLSNVQISPKISTLELL